MLSQLPKEHFSASAHASGQQQRHIKSRSSVTSATSDPQTQKKKDYQDRNYAGALYVFETLKAANNAQNYQNLKHLQQVGPSLQIIETELGSFGSQNQSLAVESRPHRFEINLQDGLEQNTIVSLKLGRNKLVQQALEDVETEVMDPQETIRNQLQALPLSKSVENSTFDSNRQMESKYANHKRTSVAKQKL